MKETQIRKEYWLVTLRHGEERTVEAIDFPPNEALRLIRRFDPIAEIVASVPLSRVEYERRCRH